MELTGERIRPGGFRECGMVPPMMEKRMTRTKRQKSVMHEWEVVMRWNLGPPSWSPGGDDVLIAETRRMSVPGGWIYVTRGDMDEPFCAPVYVPDPTAPHCQPTTTDAPPMTDEELREWLTATYGEATAPGHPVSLSIIRWTNGGQHIHLDTSLDRWWTDDTDWAPAHVVGPALWAAHKYGAR